MKLNENRGHFFKYNDEIRNLSNQMSDLANAIFETKFKDIVERYKPKTPELKDISDSLFDTEDENHNLFVNCFNTTYGMVKMLEDYARIGIVKLDYQKLKWIRILFTNDFSNENISTIKRIFNEMTMDDLAILVISYYGIALSNDEQLAAFINAFLQVDENDNLDQILEKNSEILAEKIIEAKTMNEDDEEVGLYIRFIFDLFNYFSHVFKTLHLKENFEMAKIDFEFENHYNNDEERIVEYDVSDRELERARKFAVELADSIIYIITEMMTKQATHLSNAEFSKKTEQWRRMEEAKQMMRENPIIINDDQDDSGKKPYQKK